VLPDKRESSKTAGLSQLSGPPLGIPEISNIVELLFITIENNSFGWEVKFLPTTIFTPVLASQIA
jgi:hypothetical protein